MSTTAQPQNAVIIRFPFTPPDQPPPATPAQCPTYPTINGQRTFEEIHADIAGFAGYILSTHRNTPHDARTDALQYGFIALYKKLATDGEFLADKPRTFIAKWVVFRALRATRTRTREITQTDVENSTDGDDDNDRAFDSLTFIHHEDKVFPHATFSKQLDARMDMQTAYERVSATIRTEPDPLKRSRLHIVLDALLPAAHGGSISMWRNYWQQVADLLKTELADYAPLTPTRPHYKPSSKRLPKEDTALAKRVAQAHLSSVDIERARNVLLVDNSATFRYDLLALDGIEARWNQSQTERANGLKPGTLNAAFMRVFRLIASFHDMRVSPVPFTPTRKTVFEKTPENLRLVPIVANELLNKNASPNAMLALYIYITDQPLATVTKQLTGKKQNLQYHRKQIHQRFEELRAVA